MVDNLVELAPLLSVFFAAISSSAACFAVWLNRRGQKDQQRNVVIARQQKLYEISVMEPMLEYLTVFVTTSTQRLMNMFSVLTVTANEASSPKEFLDRRRELIRELNEDRARTAWRLIAGAKAWGDPELEGAINAALDRVQDRISETLVDWENAIENTPKIPAILEMLQEHAIELLGLVRLYDPLLRTHASTGPFTAPVKSLPRVLTSEISTRSRDPRPK